eukprot:105635_1
MSTFPFIVTFTDLNKRITKRACMARECTTDSLLPIWVTSGFISGTGLMMMITSWLSFKYVSTASPPIKPKQTPDQTNANDHEDKTIQTVHSILSSKWQNASTMGRVVLWLKDIWKRKAVYLPLMAHLSDTATDFAAVIEFYKIATTHTSDECGINMWYLFALSASTMLIYRIISSMTIWRITRSWKRVVAQFLDIELFQILWVSHRLGLRSKSSPQRLISVMEAVFEAAPQSMIQIIYLLKTQRFSGIIAVSSVLSFINLTMAIIGDDKQFLNVTLNDTKRWISLHLFRILDVPSAILLYVFIWHYMSGYALTVVIVIDVIVALILFRLSFYNTDALLSILAIPFSFGGRNRHILLLPFYGFSLIRCIVLNILIWIQFAPTGDSEVLSSVLWIYASVASITKWCIAIYIFKCLSVWRNYSMKGKSKERDDIPEMLYHHYYDDAIELIFYKHLDLQHNAKKVHGDSRRPMSLLAIAARCTQHKHIFDVILNEAGLDRNITDGQSNYQTALQYFAHTGNKEQVQLLLAVADFAYVMQKNGDNTCNAAGLPTYVMNGGGTALYYAICQDIKEYSDDPKTYSAELVPVLLDGVRSIITKSLSIDGSQEDDEKEAYDHKRAEFVDGVYDDQNALYVACNQEKIPISEIRSLYDFYPFLSRAKVLEDLSSKNVQIRSFIETEWGVLKPFASSLKELDSEDPDYHLKVKKLEQEYYNQLKP